MAEPKILPPSLRPQKRYIVFEIISEHPITYGDLINAVWNSMLSFLGELGSAEARIWFIHNLYDEKTQRGVIKCRHDSVEKIRVVLSLIQMIGETRSLIKIVGVTGTIKSAKNKYLSGGTLKDFTGG
ncbi:MAG: Rpp14/Pop5 family protein [Candidatus Aenigmatarchaeota archaeon]